MTRAEAVNWIISISADIGKSQYSDLWHYEQALSEIKDMLEAEPERKIGHWILLETMPYELAYGPRIYIPKAKCSCCKHIYESYVRWDEPIMPEDADFPEYCERCGAKMEGTE